MLNYSALSYIISPPLLFSQIYFQRAANVIYLELRVWFYWVNPSSLKWHPRLSKTQRLPCSSPVIYPLLPHMPCTVGTPSSDFLIHILVTLFCLSLISRTHLLFRWQARIHSLFSRVWLPSFQMQFPCYDPSWLTRLFPFASPNSPDTLLSE